MSDEAEVLDIGTVLGLARFLAALEQMQPYIEDRLRFRLNDATYTVMKDRWKP